MTDEGLLNYLETPEALAQASGVIAQSGWVALDTEADSLHHYIEKLCLLQLSVPGHNYVIDTLAGLDLTGLLGALSQKPLILHGSDFDLRMLKRSYGFTPSEIFDTLIAAQLLGHEKLGLSDLALRYCAVKLSKTSQKADWSRRPLSPELLTYAANDTHYLYSIRGAMLDELAALGRSSWLYQCCEKQVRLVALEKPIEDSERAWQIKGSRDLKGESLTLLKALWHWRDREARRRDRPAFKILNPDVLIKTAQWAHDKPDADVAHMPGAARPLREEYRLPVNQVIREARTHPQAEWSLAVKRSGHRKKWNAQMDKKLLAIKAEREALARELKLGPGFLANNAALEMIVEASPRTREEFQKLDCLMSWQMDLLAPKILNMVE